MTKKISELTSASTPLAGTELIEIVQSGTSKKVAVSNVGGGSAITAKDEGTNLTTALSSLDFVGSGVVATNTGGAVTVTISGGSGSPAGSDKQVQYNNSGAFAGSSSFTWDESTKKLTIKGTIEAYNDGGTQADIYATSYGVNGGGIMHGRMANGTYASPTGIYQATFSAASGRAPITPAGRFRHRRRPRFIG